LIDFFELSADHKRHGHCGQFTVQRRRQTFRWRFSTADAVVGFFVLDSLKNDLR